MEIDISKLKFAEIFGDSDIDAAIFEAAHILLDEAHKNNDKETLLLLNTTNFKYIINCDNGDDEVRFSNGMLGRLYDETNDFKYLAMHNHPYGGTFTIGDLIQFLGYPKIKIIMAYSNDCEECYVMYKTEKVDDTTCYNIAKKLDDKIIEINNNKVAHRQINSLIDKLNNIGIEYMHIEWR
jgi:hypothetical protein